MISNRDGSVVHDGREVVDRIVGQIANPVRWDLCMGTMSDLGVTGVLELPPAGTLTGIAKRTLKGVETFALKTPDQLDEARAFCEQHAEHPDSPTTEAPHAPSSEPSRPAAAAKIMGVGGLPTVTRRGPQLRGDRGDRLQRRVDPAAVGHQARRWAGPDETIQMMSVHASRKALAAAGARGRTQIDCVIVATVSHMLQTPAIATAIAHELGTDQAAAFDISAACAGFCHGVALASDMVRAGSAGHVLVIGVERLTDILDLHDRGTAFIFADGAGAPWSSAPATSPASGPSSGAPTASSTT